MPQVGWLCSFTDKPKSFKECMACSKSDEHCEFTPEMFYVMQRVSSSAKDPNNPSVTQILKQCLKQVVIQDRYDYRVYPRRSWFLLRGNMIHYLFEDTMPKDGWKELYNSREITLSNGRKILVGGKVDKLVVEKKLIRDYKTTRKIPTMRSTGYGTHDLQVNIYMWIWWPVFHAEKLRLQYIDMSGTKQVKVPCMPIADVEKLVREKTEAYVNAIEGKGLPPGEFDPKNWVCKYCDVSDLCKNLTKEEQEGGNKERKGKGKQSRSDEQGDETGAREKGRAGKTETGSKGRNRAGRGVRS